MNAAGGNRNKVVVDWDGRPVGWVRDDVLDPRTHTARSLLVNLRPEARASLGIPSPTMSIPASKVGAVRRDEVALNVRMGELAMPPAPPIE